jgi:hypothetical protein
MKIGMAHAASLCLYQYLAGTGCGNIPFLQHQWFSEMFDGRRVHFAGHDDVLFLKIRLERLGGGFRA